MVLRPAYSKRVGWWPVSPQETVNICHYRGGRAAKWPRMLGPLVSGVVAPAGLLRGAPTSEDPKGHPTRQVRGNR
jgi:hypothetical protein